MNFSLDFNIIKFAESYFLLFLISFFIPKFKKKISNVVIWIIVLLSYIPMLTLYAFKNESRIFMFSSSIFWIFIFILKNISFRVKHFYNLKQGKMMCFGLACFLFILAIFSLFGEYNPSITFDFSNIYEIRAHYTATVSFLNGYLFNWIAKIIIPFLLAFFFVRRKWLYILPLLLMQVFLFSVTGHKIYFFIPFFCFGLIWIMERKNSFSWLILILIFIITMGIILYLIFDNILFMSWFTRRIMFIPSLLSFEYYNFFSKHQHVYLSYHWPFKIFLSRPYRLDPAGLIGEIYHNGSHANNGMMSDGYINFGFLGMVLWAIVYAVIFKIIDFLSYGKDQKVAICIISTLALSFISGSLLTNFLTKGLVLALFLLYLLPYNQKNNFKII
jgi:hypothetical protein